MKIRWIMLWLLMGFAFFAYIQRTGMSVVSAPMIAETAISQIQFGWALTSFLISYTIFQIPGGIFGEWLGARRALTWTTLLAVVATATIALAPFALEGNALFVALLGSCLVLGVAQAPLFPAMSGVIEAWFPSGNWGAPQGISTLGAQAGSAIAAPLTAWLMQTQGWKAALLLPGIPAVAFVAFWAWYAKDSPFSHPSVSEGELDELRGDQRIERSTRISRQDVIEVVRDKNILLLSLSYLSMNFVFYFLSFWCFLYLVQERHFTILEGGWLASLPYLGAGLGGVIGGVACDRICKRWGVRVGFRAIPLVALPAAAVLLLLAVHASNPYWAVAGLTFAFASIELTEGPFLAAATTVARQHTMAAAAVVNTGGNVGGIIATPIVAFLSAQGHWTSAFVTASAFALVSAALWLWIDSSQTIARRSPTSGQGSL